MADRVQEEKCVDYCVEIINQRNLIIEAVGRISDTWILEQIYRCIMNITRED